MITDDLAGPVTALHAFLSEDFDTHRQMQDGFDSNAARIYAVLLTATFLEASQRYFGPEHTPSDVIGFVSEARTQYDIKGDLIDPTAAERVLRAALGEDHLADGIDGHTLGRIQMTLLFALIKHQGIAAKPLDDLLGKASQEVAQYLSQRANK